MPDYPAAVWEPASPSNFKPSSRPSAEFPVNLIVMHDIEGPALSAVRWFQDPRAQVSAHYVVDAVTGKVYQQLKERDIGWHAGNREINARSVGIEQEGFAYRPGFFTPVLYEASAKLVRDISKRHNIPRDRAHIIGHFEVPNRNDPTKFGGAGGHTDPGPYYDWDYFMTLVRNDASDQEATVGGTTRKTKVLHPGELYTYSVRFQNTGDDPWLANKKDAQETERRKQGTVFIGTADGLPSPFTGRDWVSPLYIASATEGDVAPGDNATFNVPIHAPAKATYGRFSQELRVVKVPVAPGVSVAFGDKIWIDGEIVPWDIIVPPPAPLGNGVTLAPPAGWNRKPAPDGSRLYWRRAGSIGSDRLGWYTNVPVSGRFDVYVRYTSGNNRTGLAHYRVNGESRYVDQRVGGGAWRKLGRFSLSTPPSDVIISGQGRTPDATLFDSPPSLSVVLFSDSVAPGIVVAGDVRFVGPFP